jgi:hypothetical protein
LREVLEKIANVVGKIVVWILRNISIDCGKAARNKTEWPRQSVARRTFLEF